MQTINSDSSRYQNDDFFSVNFFEANWLNYGVKLLEYAKTKQD